MIVSKLNLVCGDGHWFYAPNPEYWNGRECDKSGHKTCNKKLQIVGTRRVGKQ